MAKSIGRPRWFSLAAYSTGILPMPQPAQLGQAVATRYSYPSRTSWARTVDPHEKHVKSKPRHRRAERLLTKAIIWLYSRRSRDLLPGDRSHMDVNLCDLLRRSLSFRQAWYLNMVAARNRCLCIRHNNPELDDSPPWDQDIRLWIQGRPR